MEASFEPVFLMKVDPKGLFSKNVYPAKAMKTKWNKSFILPKVYNRSSETTYLSERNIQIEAFYRSKVLDLTHESIKILGCHHGYDADLASTQNFSVLLDNIQAVLNLWRTRDLTLE